MDSRLKQRLVGALVLVVAAVIFVPMVFGPAEDETQVEAVPATREIDPLPAPSAAAPLPLPEPDARREREALAGNVAPREAVISEQPGSPPAPAIPDADASGADKDAYAVQLASFSDARNAEALERRLSEKGYAAFTTAGEGGSQKLTRVYVGPLGNPAEAKDMRERLRRETKLEGLVVRYPKR